MRTLQDIDCLQSWLNHHNPARAVVVGAGYIGLEMVENFSRRGMEVTLLERLDQAMPPMDPEMVSPVYEELQKQGVDLHLDSEVVGFEPAANDKITVVTKRNERHMAGVVILALGVKPDVQLAKQCGLEIGPRAASRGRSDAHQRSGDFRRGRRRGSPRFCHRPTDAHSPGRTGQSPGTHRGRRDLRARRPLSRHARHGRGGRVRSDAGHDRRFRKNAPPRGHRLSKKPTRIHSITPSYYPGAERISIKLLFAPDTGRLLGAQAVGKAGVDKRIDVLAMAIQKGATVFDLEEAELCYAPQYGSAKDPINIAGFVAGNILRGDVAAASWTDWKALAAANQTPVTLDVRPPTAVASGAIPGTIRIPLGELRSRLNELPRDKEIWVHCVVGQTSYYGHPYSQTKRIQSPQHLRRIYVV